MEMSGNVCKRCLIREMAGQDNLYTIQQYVDHIEEDIKTPTEDYENRLEICKQCDHLLNGMCRICGCFVEMRAAVKSHYCPSPAKKW